MGGRRRDPTTASFTPEPLIDALNDCLNPASRFNIRVSECALEFFARLYEQLDVRPDFLVSHMEKGTCQGCGVEYSQVQVMVTSW